MDSPYTLNVCYLDNGTPETYTTTFAGKNEALAAAREEVQWSDTVHATVTHEPSGVEIFDAPGTFVT
jgi:hypothetical protein